MNNNPKPFPWGIYIGDLIDGSNTIPLCLDSKQGGFVVLFDEQSEQTANNFIENIALKLLEVLPLGSLEVDVFNFGNKRFMHLAALSQSGVYQVAYAPNKATNLFNMLEELVLDRQHNLLSFDTTTLSEYNVAEGVQERYHLLLINLEHFPDELSSPRRIKTFFESAYEAGFYIIAFGNKVEVDENKSKALPHILNKFPLLKITQNYFKLTKKLFDFTKLLEDLEFEYVNDNKEKIIKSILREVDEEVSNSKEQDFLQIPIGIVGRQKQYFTMGLKSQNYHAFIAGMTGMGKTNLLNSIITNIAKHYTAKEVELYLMDYKPAGAEFNIFDTHPNCKKLFLDNRDLEPALAILKEFQDEMYIRGEMLKGKSIDEYNAKNPEQVLSRKILIIDEIQRMFSGDWKGANEFNTLLEDIIKAGRSSGLHLILTTQSLKQINMKDSIMGQIALKISFRLNDSMEAMKIFGENKEAIAKVTKLPKYHFVYSDFNQMVEVKADYLDKDEIEDVLTEVIHRRKFDEVVTPEVFSVAMTSQSKEEKVEKQSSAHGYVSKYDTSSEKELLERLKVLEGGNE